jgi:ATP-dependent DNA helicase RecG
MGFFDTPIEYLKGIGPAKAEVIKKELGLFTFGDFIQHYPFRYIDKTKFYTVAEIHQDLPYVQFKARITSKNILGERRGKRLVAFAEDDSGSIELVWFQGIKWIEKSIIEGKEYVIFGKASAYGSRLNIAHPEIELLTEFKAEQATALQPVYSSTEKLKNFFLDSRGILKLQRQLLLQAENEFPEFLPMQVIQKYKMLDRKTAMKEIHFPTDARLLQRAQARLKFEELFVIQMKLLRINKGRKLNSKGFLFSKVASHFNTFYNDHLPFELTNAQKRVIKEIRSDTNSGFQMNRLLQGDVGSGKTVVALLSMLIALDNGFQACMMAPTEILAQQHFQGLSELLKDMPIKIRILTGSSKTKDRRVLLEELENGEIDILLGTHALLEDPVVFKNLGLVIIDEQHRFGVEQRAKLWKKNVQPPHILVMTATPIPRTLAMTLYGDLDTSIIDELPAGRKPIETLHQYETHRLKVFGFLQKEIAKGRQIYIVYPLIKESEKLDLIALEQGYETITKAFPTPQYRVSILHGKMKPADKELEMQLFVSGKTNIMVATTVIEVGVNVPNASVMLIENAERFGLSQLHQLRGRVGRGAEQSYCILMSGNKIGNDAKARLQTMVQTNNGFEIAEVDLKLRGPGDLQGTQQSGVLDLHLADLAKDQLILQEARITAEEILAEDFYLDQDKFRALKRHIDETQRTRENWDRIS